MPGTAGRGNGLTAASYAPLADLAPHVADAVLELLAREGIAAYAAPASERSGQFVAATVDRVLDRVHVDSAARVLARALVDAHGAELGIEAPGGRAADEDAAWAQIVAAFAAPSAPDPVPRWPAAGRPGDPGDPESPGDPGLGVGPDGAAPDRVGPDGGAEDGAAPDGAAPDGAAPDGAARDRVGPDGGAEDGVDRDGGGDDRPADPDGGRRSGRLLRPARDLTDGWAPYVDPPAGPEPPRRRASDRRDDRRDDEGHFVPPPPPPVPRGDAVTRWAWAAVLGAPAFFFVVALAGMRLAEELLLLAAGAFVAGFVTLVARMKDRPSDDDPDDGAVV